MPPPPPLSHIINSLSTATLPDASIGTTSPIMTEPVQLPANMNFPDAVLLSTTTTAAMTVMTTPLQDTSNHLTSLSTDTKLFRTNFRRFGKGPERVREPGDNEATPAPMTLSTSTYASTTCGSLSSTSSTSSAGSSSSGSASLVPAVSNNKSSGKSVPPQPQPSSNPSNHHSLITTRSAGAVAIANDYEVRVKEDSDGKKLCLLDQPMLISLRELRLCLLFAIHFL